MSIGAISGYGNAVRIQPTVRLQSAPSASADAPTISAQDEDAVSVAISPAGRSAAAAAVAADAAVDGQAYAQSTEKVPPIDPVEKQPPEDPRKDSDADAAKASEAAATKKTENPEELSEGEKQEVRELAARDREVKAHEQAHLAGLGGHRSGGASYTFRTGPDGKRYAVGGEVPVDVSAEGTPSETISKAQTIRRAALAPADPSGADRAVAAKATQLEAQARAEQAEQAQSANDDDKGSEGEGTAVSRPKINVTA